MVLALLLAAQVVAPPEIRWADIAIDDTRGGRSRIEVLPQLGVEGGHGVVKSILLRRSNTFGRGEPTLSWATSESCPGLRGSLDAIAGVTLEDLTLSKQFEGSTAPPPPHSQLATVRIAAAELSVVPGSRLGVWLQGVLDASARCWRPTPPVE